LRRSILLLPFEPRQETDMKGGKIVWAKIPFAEGDGRYKIRPVMILMKARLPNGEIVYLAAGKYSSTSKCRGEVEVVVDADESLQLGIDPVPGVFRFSRDSLVVFLEKDVHSEAGCFTSLSECKQKAFRNAAKAIHVEL
jgi:hypothetical protein